MSKEIADHSNEPEPTREAFEFTNDWFENNIRIWNHWLAQLKPQRALEIGSYEGRSACHLIETCTEWSNLEIHCVDTWEGGVEHQKSATKMSIIEKRFDKNTGIASKRATNSVKLVKHKSLSHPKLAELMCQGKNEYFDLIYIDGSHQAPDVITDAVMAFPLLRGGA